jgi:hypothetical protein
VKTNFAFCGFGIEIGGGIADLKSHGKPPCGYANVNSMYGAQPLNTSQPNGRCRHKNEPSPGAWDFGKSEPIGRSIWQKNFRNRTALPGERAWPINCHSQASINRRVPSDCPTRALGEPPWHWTL